MTRVLDPSGAWRLLLAVGDRAPLPDGEVELGTPGAGPAGPQRIRVDATGRWHADGEVTGAARDLLDIFLPLAVRERFVVGQLGQSLDGRIATASGHSHYINGPRDIQRLHRLRALADAVVVGAGTVASDDPRLTVREVEGENPVRVVLDPRGRVDAGRRVFTDGAAPTLWLQGAAVPAEAPGDGNRRPRGTSRGGEGGQAGVPLRAGESLPLPDFVQLVTLPTGDDGGFDPHRVIAALAERGLHRVLVEGGGITVSRFLRARALDRLHLSVAPLLLGSGRPSITLPPIHTLDEALRPPARHFLLGDDMLFDLELAGD